MADPKRVGVLISGRGSNMAALIDAARQPGCPYRVVLVGSDRTDAPGLSLAAEAGIETFAQPARTIGRAAFEAAVTNAFAAAGVGTIALAGYMRLLSPAFVERWAGRILNIHPSLLPRHKGLDTHARAIAAGDRQAGCSVHVVTAELDSGAVLGQASVPIRDGDTAETLAARVLVEEHRLYPQTLAEFVKR